MDLTDHHEDHAIASAGVSARIVAQGGELVSLRDRAGEELLWQAGPQWRRHAPILFPIVGRLSGDRLRHDGCSYTMTQHGFARDWRFAFTQRAPDAASLRLQSDAATLERFPFPFVLDLDYRVGDSTLIVASTVRNVGVAPLPFSLGAHPGFRWPLQPSVPKHRHRLRFGDSETGDRWMIENGLVAGRGPRGFEGDTLALDEALFAADAIVLPDVRSRSVRYEALADDGTVSRAIEVGWEGYRDLGIWSVPTGAPFLCIEPWYGTASPAGWDGPFVEKPGILLLAPGEERRFQWHVAV